MRVFVAVARQERFAAAARSLDLSTSSVSRHLMELEAWLGISLLRRTTRRLSLTEDGARFLAECERIVDDVERLRASAQNSLEQPSGTLRLTAPLFLAKHSTQHVIPDFLETHPNVKVELKALDRFVDLVDEGFDLALRVGDLPDSTLIARGLGNVDLQILASPSYLAARGLPETPKDLKNHNCIVDSAASFLNRWPMKSGGKRQAITVSGNITVNNGEIARDLARQGLGLALLPHFFATEQLQTGELVEVLEGQVDSSIGLFIVYPQSRHQAPKVRSFVEHVIQHFER